MSNAQIAAQIVKGGGRMPAFGTGLTPAEIQAIIAFLHSDPPPRVAPAYPDTGKDNYVFDGYNRFLDPDGYPAIAPPWGTLNALNIDTGQYLWRHPLGYYPELNDKTTGSENYGGSVVTAGGVLFIAATVYDNKFRAFDKRMGELLWETDLPAAGVATPATYMVGNRQYVVIGAGGGKNAKAKPGGEIIAYSLP